MIYGVYMRLELLMREQKRVELLNECVRYFYDMTQKPALYGKITPLRQVATTVLLLTFRAL